MYYEHALSVVSAYRCITSEALPLLVIYSLVFCLVWNSQLHKYRIWMDLYSNFGHILDCHRLIELALSYILPYGN